MREGVTGDVREETCGVCFGARGQARFWGDWCYQCRGSGKVKVLVQIVLGGRTRKAAGRRKTD